MVDGDLVDLADARVLVIDDNRLNRDFARDVLITMGLSRLESAADGAEGLAKVESFSPDLILLDLIMPVMGGMDFLKALRANPRHAMLPVLVLSAVVDQQTRNALFAAGATDYIGKPIDRQELLARVEGHLRSHMMLAHLRRYRDRLAEDLRNARAMQQALLPDQDRMAEIRERFGLRINAVFTPSAELGGDLWGLAPLDDHRLALFTADFSGHGVTASINTFRLHLLLQDHEALMGDPGQVLEKINLVLKPLLPRGQFATMTLVVMDTERRTVLVANAGGPAPILALPGEAPRPIGLGGLPLGISAMARYHGVEVAFPAGAQLSLFSDALIDAPGADGRPLGEEWVAEMLAEILDEDPAITVVRAMVAFASRSPGEFRDDVTWVQVTSPSA